MAIYDTNQAKTTPNTSNVQREESPEKGKQRPTDLVPEENKVQKKDGGTTPPADGAAQNKDGKQEGAADPQKEAAEKAKKEREAQVTAKWQSLLGDWLGGELAKVVLESVSLDALNGYIQDGLKSAGGAVNDVIKDQTKPADQKQIDGVKKFSEALSGILTGQIDKWMASPGAQKVLLAVSNWVQDNPKAVMAIVGAAVIGGAIAAYAVNPAIDIAVPLGLGGGWEAKAGLDLGKLRDICYQGAHLTVSNKSTKIEFSHKKEDKDGKTTEEISASGETKQEFGKGSLFTGSGKVSITDDKVSVKLDSSLKTTVGGKEVEFGAGYNTDGPITGKIKVGSGGETTEITGTKNGDIVTFSTKQIFTGGSFETKASSDGKEQKTATANVGAGQTMTMTGGSDGNKVGYENKNVGGSGVSMNASAGTNGQGQTEFKAGAKYDNGKLKTQLDLMMLEGKGSMNLSAGYQEDGWKFDATLKLDDKRMTELALKMGYQNPDEFKGFLLGYKRSWSEENKQYADHVDALLEYSVGKWYGRAMGGMDIMGNKVTKANLDLGLGYQLNKNWMLTGGMQMNGAMNQEGTGMNMGYKPYVGAQYNGVGVAAYYDTQTKGAGLMLTIPFGR